MGLANFRSLLIAAFILSNCVTWSSSRHHFTHNVHGHRSRHRRQGAGLYLPSSYVLPGGEGSGGWGDWGTPSPCSRTCGGGVASQKRICIASSDGQCTGGDTRYFSCQTQDCPDDSKDFRAQQCSEYDNVAFKGIRYEWVPYTRGPNPCELNCMPRGERFYYRQQNKVIDGTRCNEESFDVCVNGTCQPVGCDMMLGSSAREDKCRVCRGDGANCHTVDGLLDTQDLRNGYNDILLIPQGATSIYIAEVRPSSNYLAIRAKNNTYYLNGDYHIDFPRSIVIAGATWHYERSQDGLPSPDKLRCQGPTDEPLLLSLLLQEPNVGVEYEYSVPSAMAPPPNAQYNWVHDEFTPCSASCGGGVQVRNVTCRSREELEVVEDSLCETIVKPVLNQTCNTQACPARWVEGPWSACSKRCGKGGSRSRQVHCEKIIANGYPSIVADEECFELLGKKPPLFDKCNENATCPIWFTGPWKPCDKLCGEGKQTRQVVCYQKTDGRIEVLSDDLCDDEKPEAEQPCLIHPCDGVDWVISDWSGCDSCLSKVRTRTAVCATKDHKVVNDSLCEYHKTPVLEEECDKTKLPACEVQWYATQWSKCSAECGTGVQSRRVFCGLFDGASVVKVEDSRCNSSTRYNDTKPCEVPKEKCPSKWFAGPWSECTASCGGGEQYRRVMCLRGVAPAADCDVDNVLDSTQSCNMHTCNDDEMLPVSPNSTPLMDDDDYEDCEEEGDYPEVGAEEDTSLSTGDMMFSDSPFTTDFESEFITDTGSGFDTLSTEGSGFGSTDATFSTDEDWTSAESGSTDESSDSSINTEETSETGSTETDSTVTEPTYNSSVSTDLTASSSSDSFKATTEAVKSSSSSDLTENTSATDETGSTERTESETKESGATVSKSGSTEEAITAASVSSDYSSSTSSESFDYTESDYTDLSSTEGTGSTETSSSTEEFTELSSSTESDITEGSTESSATEETASTESDSTESSISTETGSTVSDSSDETTEPVSSESTTAGSSGSTEESTKITTEISSTVESSSTSESSSESASTTESGSSSESSSSTESGPTTESSLTDSSSEGSTTESGSSVESGSTESDATTELGASTESEITESSSTEPSGSTESTVTESTELPSSTEETGSTTNGATEETGSTESAATEETSETSETGSTGTEDTESTVSGSTEETVSTESTSEGSTESSEESTETTPWDWSSTIEMITRKPKCKPRIAKCSKSKFGCCPDRRTPAAGPFDEGCATPKTCGETKFGCCPDGVSPATGPKDKGCPVAPCADTLFGCCKSDNKTAAEGNDQEGCPPPPPACKSSKYGCCNDSKTAATGPKKKGCPETASLSEAKKPQSCASSEFGCCYDNTTVSPGPEGEGCPCNATQYGCCPDGVSTAEGAQMEGCVMSCNSSTYGCCPDGETPAHGYDNEGCCLLYAFGCCPDNFKPAEGPHLEGCGCQYAHFGCCPDNITIARGPNNDGCGCEHSEHGCCPDRHTEASGPNYEGCDCSTFQFGCCDDGVTAAKGPGRQGCLCQQSQHGCCGDEKTAATGPDQAGCDCSTSKFGCCPDGVTAAAGSKFLGCTDKPENRQAACGLSTDRGPCTNYTVLWYYDIEYGGCSRFWYGGCEGNDNRFTSKEECEDTCVQPSPKDACNLPKVKGACTGYHPRWYYDAEREHCGQFIFGGCLGNANNFDSRELCQKHCEPAKSDDQCTLPIDNGPCAGNFVRWGFNSESRRCDRFTWGGCGGNTNRFSSEAACLHRCNPPGAPQPECNEPKDVGNCTDKVPAWSFSPTENRCMPFYYTGCGGNRNRFDSERNCAENCPSSYVKDICTLPALTGECADYSEKWYYDTAIKRCRQFYYGGCGGNENRFSTQQECEAQCRERAPLTTTTPRPTPPVTTPASVENVCSLPSMTGECDQYTEKWFFDSSISRCRPFYYGGCGGNGNRFENERECVARCSAPAPTPPTPPPSTGQDICQLPMMQGSCEESLMRWFYDPASDSCSQFTYSGCNGNGNRFESREACESRCRTGPAGPEVPSAVTRATTTPAPAGADLSPECRSSSSPDEECAEEEAGPVWYLDVSQRACVVHVNEPSGSSCRRAGVFDSEEACERACGAFRDIDVCRYPMDPGPCRSAIPKFFYNQTLDACQPFTYGGCHGGPNRFSTELECQDICKEEKDPCKKRAKQVNCVDYEVTWFFDETRDECFSYGSCDHDDTNKFTSREQCEGQCRRAPTIPLLTTTTRSPLPPPQPQPTAEEECRTPTVLDTCNSTVVAYYYDIRSGSCLAAELGGCGLALAHPTEEACLRRCGEFRGLDPCRSPLDVGLGGDSVAKYYWKQSSGRCEQYVYSGSGGGPNRFSTIEECEQICGHTGPDIESNEVLPDCDRYNDECATIRCEFSVQRSRTRDGCERCTCVQVEVDCEPLQRECETLKCAYGLDRAVGPDGCERCTCLKHPCEEKQCPAGERCVASAYRDPVSQDLSYTADCHQMTKPGSCPVEQTTAEGQCRRECNDDADCRGVGKCCARGCSQLCLAPAGDLGPPTTTFSPELPQAPQANPVTEPEVSATEGGKATLRCLFHGNPPPKITWRRGEITIDGDVGRYRLLSDGALEIVSLYRNDSGVYICVAENVHGVSRQEIRLQVNDPVEAPVGITGDSNAVVTGELGRSLNIRCLAYGYPPPSIYWYRGRNMLPYSSQQYEARGNVLQIRRLSVDTLGEYACQAYNGVGKAALWSVVVRAYQTDEERENEHLVPRERPPTPTRVQTLATTTLAPEIDVPVYTVAVNTSIPLSSVSAAAGAELSIPCDVEGYPLPDVYWTKDGARLTSSERVALTDARLTISSLAVEDSGVYGCHARNDYSSHSSTIQVNVQGVFIPVHCTDNPFFADCQLIVRSKFCNHQYYSKFCCKSCVEAGQLNPLEMGTQADEAWKKKK